MRSRRRGLEHVQPASGPRRESIFLSYSRTDAPRRLLEVLTTRLGYAFDVRWDQALPPGAEWRDTLWTWLAHECAAAIILLTPGATQSTWVLNEVIAARLRASAPGSHFKIIPILANGLTLDELRTSRLEPQGLDALQAIHVAGDDAEAVHEAVNRVLSVLTAGTLTPENRWFVRCSPPSQVYPRLVEAGFQPLVETLEVERHGTLAREVPEVSVGIPGYLPAGIELSARDLILTRQQCWKLARPHHAPGLAPPPSASFDSPANMALEVRVDGQLIAREPIQVLPSDHIGIDHTGLATAALHVDGRDPAIEGALAGIEPSDDPIAQLREAFPRLRDACFASAPMANAAAEWHEGTRTFRRGIAPFSSELDRGIVVCAAAERLGCDAGLVVITQTKRTPRVLVALSTATAPDGFEAEPQPIVAIDRDTKPKQLLSLEGDCRSFRQCLANGTRLFAAAGTGLLLSLRAARACGLRPAGAPWPATATARGAAPSTRAFIDPSVEEIIELLASPSAEDRPVLVLGDSLDPTVAPTRLELARELSERAGLAEPHLRTAAYRLAQQGEPLGSIAARMLRTRSARSHVYRELLRLPFSAIISLHPDAALELEAAESEDPLQIRLGDEELRGWHGPNATRALYLLGGSARTEDRLCLTWNDEERLCNDLEQARDVRFLMVARSVVLLGCELSSRVLQELMQWTAIHANPFRHAVYVIGGGRLPQFWRSQPSVRVIEHSPLECLSEWSRYVVAGKATPDAPPAARGIPVPSGRRTPYKFLDAYGPDDEGLFHGRDEDAARLKYDLRTSRNGLSILSGRSGVGKTSLVHARLIPQLRRERGTLVAYCRFGQDPTTALLQQVAAELGKTQPRDATLASGLESLLGGSHREVLLVVDQLDEALILRGERSVKQFMDDMQALLSVRPPTLRVLLIIREDYLGWLTHFYQGAIESTTRLAALSRDAARAAILEPAAPFSIEIEDGFIDAVLDDLSPGLVMPASLQIVLDQTLHATEYRRLDLHTYRETLGGAASILRGHLDNVIRGLDAEHRDTVRSVLRALVSSQETNAIRTLDELTALTRLSRPTLTAALYDLVHTQRLVRELGHNGDQFELMHDSLGPSVMQWLEESDRRRQVTRERVIRAIEDGDGTPDRPLDRGLLQHVEKYGMRLDFQEASEALVTSWAIHGGNIGDWWGEIEGWTVAVRHRTLIEAPLCTQNGDALTRILRGEVGAQPHRLGSTDFQPSVVEQLAQYVLLAPYDVVDRTVRLCSLDTSPCRSATVELIERSLSHAPEIEKMLIRRSLLSRPVVTALRLARWLSVGVLGQRTRAVPALMHLAQLRQEPMSAAERHWLERSVLLTQLQDAVESARAILLEPLRLLTTVLKRHAFQLAPYEVVTSPAWQISYDLITELVRETLDGDRPAELERASAARTLALAMSHCLDFLYEAQGGALRSQTLIDERARFREFTRRVLHWKWKP